NAPHRETAHDYLEIRIFQNDLLAYECCVVDDSLQTPICHRRAIDCATLTRSGSQSLHSRRVTENHKVPARKKCHERIVVIAIFTDFVVLKTASKRRHHENNSTNPL